MILLIKNGDNYNNHNQMWQIDNQSELEELAKMKGADPGSIAYINNPTQGALSKMWMLDNNRNWNII